MSGRLAGKLAMVTGGARGIAGATARLFAAEGACVLIGDIVAAEGGALADELEVSYGPGRAAFIELDVSAEEQWASAMTVAEERFGGLDILVNNAGKSGPVGIEAVPMEGWHRIIAVNQTGTLLGMRAAIPLIRRRGGGSIVNISSIYGIVAADASPAYQASKAAVRMLSKVAALEYGSERIRVNSVHPGLTDTAILAAVGEEKVAHRLTRTPLNRVCEPIEIAYGILFLASDDASFVTGAELVIDGGYTAS